MMRSLSGLKFGYRDTVAGAYDAALYHGLAVPPETKDEIVDRALEVLRSL